MTTSGSSGAPQAPDLVSAGAAALFSRGVVIAAGLINSLLLPLVLDQKGVGQYFLSQFLIAGFAIVAQLGLTYSIPATVTAVVARNDLGTARRLSATILIFSACAGAALSVALVLAAPLILDLVDPAERSTWMTALLLIAVIAPVSALAALLVELLRALHAIRAAANLAAFASIFAASYAGGVLVAGARATLSGSLIAVLVGSVTCVGLGVWILGKRMASWPASPPESVRTATVIRGTLPNLFTTLILFGLSNLDLIILVQLGQMHDVAQYGLALRLTALIVVPLAILNSAAAPLAVQARSTADNATVDNILTRVAVGGTVAAAVLYLGFALVGYGFIAVWNQDYENSYWLTLVLGLGNVLHAFGGSAGVLLMIWGDQRWALLLTLATGVLAVVLCLVGYWLGGIFGLAFAAAFANAFQVACFVCRVRKRFALDPSLLRRWQRDSLKGDKT